MLSDREKLVLHFCCMLTIAKMTGLPKYQEFITNMVEDVRKNRCRSLSKDDVITLMDEVSDEMIGGRHMFKFLVDETIEHTGNQFGEDLR